MIVNSISFLLFFIIVFIVYYLLSKGHNPKYQNAWLLVTSYFFYGYADIRMILLLLSSTIVYYFWGIWLKRFVDQKHWKAASRVTTLGVCIGVGILVYFKYLGFFADSIALLLNNIGFNVSWTTLNIVVPIGVSFFTFKLISYIIEIHRERIEPCKDFIEFALYIAFFPTILSGPIDRPNKFLPQLRKIHTFDYNLAVDGCRQILWGMFAKMCIADNIAPITDSIWSNVSAYESNTLLLVALLYTIQMYTDFDGYSNMAIGVSKVLGINVARNFNRPFISLNIAEFWRKWHMSLTSWLTDYVFSPLNIAFRNYGDVGISLAVIINFVLVGFWHGANWTFGLFGLYHGLLFIPLIITKSFTKKSKIRENQYKLPFFKDFSKMIGTFCLVTIGLVIFRAPSISSALEYFGGLCNINIINFIAGFQSISSLGIKLYTFVFILIIVISEWLTRKKEFSLQISENSLLAKHSCVRIPLYILLATIILLYKGVDTQFIYFQF